MMTAHWLYTHCDLAATWRTRTARATFVAVSGLGTVAGATVAVPGTTIAKTNPRGMPGGLVTRRLL